MEPIKLTKEDIDKVRNIEGFPLGTDEDIIALSNAPYYTACPNPFIEGLSVKTELLMMRLRTIITENLLLQMSVRVKTILFIMHTVITLKSRLRR